MKHFSFLLLIIFIVSSFLTITNASSSAEDQTKTNNKNIFRPTAAIVTKKGGAIVMLEATLDPPIQTEGYHEISLSWCSRADWFDCLLNSTNQTSQCRCSIPGTYVEDSVRFHHDDDNKENENENSNDSSSSTSSSCSVVSHRWSVDDDFQSQYEKFIKQKNAETRILERMVKGYNHRLDIITDKLNNFNKKENVSDISEYLTKIDQLENEVATLNEKSTSANEQIAENRKAIHRHQLNNLGRAMKVQLYCHNNNNNQNKNKKMNAFSRITAQTTIPGARWAPSHTLLIDTASSEQTQSENDSSSSFGQVRMAAKISQESYVDWKDVTISLRQGAPGEDSTTNENAPDDEQPLNPWIVTMKSYAPEIPVDIDSGFMNQQQLRDNVQKQKVRSKKAPGRAGGGRKEKAFAEPFSASVMIGEAIVADDGADEDEISFEEETFTPPTTTAPPPSATTTTLGSSTEETKLPHPVTIPKNGHSMVEIGTGNISSKLHRVVAAYRCRPDRSQSRNSNNNQQQYNNIFYQQDKTSPSKKRQICALPVFLRSNVTNLNSFSILGGPTRVIVDGVPFNPFDRTKLGAVQSSSSPLQLKNIPSIPPNSWNWVELGEDTRIRVQRYEKSNIMSGTAADKDKNWWETLVKSEAPRNHVAVKFEIKIVNAHKVPMKLNVRDQFPRTNSDEIEIKLDEETLKNKFLLMTSLPKNNNDAKDNKCSHPHPNDATKCIATRSGGEELQWEVEIPGNGASIVIPFGFTVTWPKTKYLHGLV